MSEEKKLRGRRTKDEEITAYLEALGLDRSELEAGRIPEAPEPPPAADVGDEPETYQEMYRKAIPLLWRDFASLNGVAKVNAFRAIQQLAKEDPGGSADDEVVEPDPLIADVVDGIVKLPVERKREILERELERLGEERDRILEVLNA